MWVKVLIPEHREQVLDEHDKVVVPGALPEGDEDEEEEEEVEYDDEGNAIEGRSKYFQTEEEVLAAAKAKEEEEAAKAAEEVSQAVSQADSQFAS